MWDRWQMKALLNIFLMIYDFNSFPVLQVIKISWKRSLFGAVAPTGPMTYAFTQGKFLLLLIPLLLRPSTPSKLKSQPLGSNPASRLKYQPSGSNPSKEALKLLSIGYWPLWCRCPSNHQNFSYTYIGAMGTADHLTHLRLFIFFEEFTVHTQTLTPAFYSKIGCVYIVVTIVPIIPEIV